MSQAAGNVLEIQNIEITALRPDPYNPRSISDAELEALTRSIQEFGFVDPVIARREDGTVIAGHQRLVAARRLGFDTVPVIFLDLPPEQARLLAQKLEARGIDAVLTREPGGTPGAEAIRGLLLDPPGEGDVSGELVRPVVDLCPPHGLQVVARCPLAVVCHKPDD